MNKFTLHPCFSDAFNRYYLAGAAQLEYETAGAWRRKWLRFRMGRMSERAWHLGVRLKAIKRF